MLISSIFWLVNNSTGGYSNPVRLRNVAEHPREVIILVFDHVYAAGACTSAPRPAKAQLWPFSAVYNDRFLSLPKSTAFNINGF